MSDIDELGLLCCCWDDPRGIMRMFEQETIEDFDYLCFFDGKFSQWDGEREFPENEIQLIVKDYGDTHDVNIYYERIDGKTEAEKRNHMFYRAYQIGMDWGLQVDSDEIPYIDKHLWNQERAFIKESGLGGHAVICNNYGILQRRAKVFNMREQPYLLKTHSQIYSSRDGRDMAEDIIKTSFDIKSITLEHDKSYHSDYRWDCRRNYATTNH